MNVNKEHLIYAGVGLLVLLILINSTKEVKLKEVSEDKVDVKNFDHTNLPTELKPPYRLAEGEQLPRPIRRNLNLQGISIKPRFDTNDFQRTYQI
jgi:hypothetical protein